MDSFNSNYWMSKLLRARRDCPQSVDSVIAEIREIQSRQSGIDYAYTSSMLNVFYITETLPVMVRYVISDGRTLEAEFLETLYEFCPNFHLHPNSSIPIRFSETGEVNIVELIFYYATTGYIQFAAFVDCASATALKLIYDDLDTFDYSDAAYFR